MTKRSPGKFKRRKQDAYDTPLKAVEPLIPHLMWNFNYVEPCAGNGSLNKALFHLWPDASCIKSSDINPRAKGIIKADAFDCVVSSDVNYIITNPPWTRSILHPMIDHFRKQCTTWLLFDADWMHTKQAIPYLKYCNMIVSVGRVSWMQNGISGLDNCAWYRFGKDSNFTIFTARNLI